MNGAAPVTASGVKPRRLVLHFDINKTIVMRDPSNNVNNSTLTVSVLVSYISLAIVMQPACQARLGKACTQEG